MSEDQKETSETASDRAVPPFIQIITAISNAFGRGADDILSDNVLYGLDAKGRVWEWNFADPDCEGSEDGWALMPNTVFKEGKEPPQPKKTR